MTTLKLTKKPNDVPGAGKPPVRRADPAKRDRSKPPPKPVLQVSDKQNSESESTRQRNHRFDGKPHGYSHPSEDKKPVNRPLRSPLRTEAHDQPARPTKPVEKKAAGIDTADMANASVDTRATARPDRNEPQYRQAPRRGGKARDGYDAREHFSPQSLKKDAGNKEVAQQADLPRLLNLPRLSKLMAERGLCSRREADDWIVNGWVKVNGAIIDTLGTRVATDVEIVISGYAYEQQAEQVTILLHKPVGYVSGQAEDGYQPAIVLVHPDNEWLDDPNLNAPNLTQPKEFQRGFLRGLAPAGRLDIDSTGLLVLTQDGRVARHLIGEDSTVEKEYLVRVEGILSDADLKRLNYGLSLDGEKLKPAKVSWQNEDQLRFVLREGKKRQIRRMCEMVGLHVVGLKRIRIGSINLGKLPMGQWRYLRANEKF